MVAMVVQILVHQMEDPPPPMVAILDHPMELQGDLMLVHPLEVMEGEQPHPTEKILDQEV